MLPGGIAVVIVTHNSETVLDKCLDVLTRQHQDQQCQLLRILIVDSGSTDSTYVTSMAERYGVRYVLLERNVGYGSACNYGARSIPNADWFVFMNPDVRIAESAILKLTIVANSKSLTCVGPSLVDDSGNGRSWYGRAITPPWKSRTSGWWVEGGVIRCEAFSGALIAIQATTFWSVDGFDERFFLYCEEIDLHKRIVELGYSIGVLSDVEAVHFGAASSSNATNRWRSVERAVSHSKYMRKHYGPVAGWLAVLWNGLRMTLMDQYAPHRSSYLQFWRSLQNRR